MNFAVDDYHHNAQRERAVGVEFRISVMLLIIPMEPPIPICPLGSLSRSRIRSECFSTAAHCLWLLRREEITRAAAVIMISLVSRTLRCCWPETHALTLLRYCACVAGCEDLGSHYYPPFVFDIISGISQAITIKSFCCSWYKCKDLASHYFPVLVLILKHVRGSGKPLLPSPYLFAPGTNAKLW